LGMCIFFSECLFWSDFIIEMMIFFFCSKVK
jgi:hypothetical protein